METVASKGTAHTFMSYADVRHWASIVTAPSGAKPITGGRSGSIVRQSPGILAVKGHAQWQDARERPFGRFESTTYSCGVDRVGRNRPWPGRLGRDADEARV